MRKTSLFWALLGAVLVVSCVDAPDNLTEPVLREDGLMTVVASLGDTPMTKTAIQADEVSIYWTPGDAINLFYGDRSSGKFTAQISEPVAVAEFVGNLTVATGSSEVGHEAQAFWGVYPYNVGNSCDGTGVTLPIPTEQGSAPGTFADKLNPSVATSSNLGLAFYNVGSWFIFSVTQEGITSASFRGNDNEDVAGRVRVTMGANNRPVTEVVDGAKSITISAPSGSSFIPGELYYLVLIPQTLQQGYTLTLYKGDLQAECVVTKSSEFKRSSYRRKRNADEGLTFTPGPSPQTGNITFADDLVKSICVANWDTSGDGALSYQEAASVTDLGDVFEYTDITSFDELQYFTGVERIDGTFRECVFLTSVILPDSVSYIGDYTFSGCADLAGILIPVNVNYIGVGAFQRCSNLTEITIPSAVTYINGGTFQDCRRLTQISLPSGLTSIGASSFSGCSSLAQITIPSGVVDMYGGVFKGCSSLASITLPDGLTIIWEETFYGCSSLTSITIPSGVTSINAFAFYGCSSLTEISIPSKVAIIGREAFTGCASLTSITLPSRVTSIGRHAFRGCNSLTSIAIPSRVSIIDTGTFYGCSSLTSITLPDGLTSIGNNAFSDCTNLTSISIPSGVTSIGGNAFQDCSSLTSITIPSGVTSIEGYTFHRCLSLTEISIPSGVTRIDDYAFATCRSLNKVVVNAVTPPSLGARFVTYECPIYVPSGSVNAYKAAEGWSEFADWIQAIQE